MFVRVFGLVLLAAILAEGAPASFKENIRTLEAEILDLLLDRNNEEYKDTRKCIPTNPHDLNVDGSETPSPVEVNECDEGNRFNAKADCGDFDVSQCGYNDCVLGYETDDKGCVKSCACRAEGLLEGDIMLSAEDAVLVDQLRQADNSDRAASKFKRKWNNLPQPDGTFVVPYVIDSSIETNPRASAAVSAAIAQYAAQTCIRFKPRSSENDYIEFFVGKGCWSYVGRNNGKQQLSVGRGCEWKGVVMHEMMHAMGFWHEHSRPDRDEVVEIVYDNIHPKMKYNFKKMSRALVDSMGSAYDTGSVMQYGGFSFSINRKPTIVDKATRQPIRAQRRGFSTEDVKQLRSMFNCRNG